MESHTPAPVQGDEDTSTQSLQAKIDQMTKRAIGADLKSAFVSNIWPTLQSEYEIMKKRLLEFCETTLKQERIACQVTGRTKAVDSVKKSLDRREKALQQQQFTSISAIFDEIHDLVGLRIVLQYPDDMQRAIDFIKGNFSEVRQPAVFRSDREVGRYWKPWFGAYQTRNYRLRLEDQKCRTLSQFCGVLFEIQLTTIAEDLYNRFAHTFLYKGLPETLSRQDEMVIDMAHGISLCYSLCLMYMKENLGKTSDKIQNKDILMAETTSFHQNLIRGTSLDNFATPEGLATAADIPPEAYKSTEDLKEWIDRRISNILTEVRSTSQKIRKEVLSKLPVVKGAAFNSHAEEHHARCHPDTRTELLCQIRDWTNNPQAEGIFWLCGMAGTGKSTISRTVASQLSAEGVLGASFLFKKGDGDRGKAAKFFTTIASQLVHQLPFLATHVRHAIESDPAIADKNNGEQFQKLILEPLNKCKDNPYMPTLVSVVIDALDECDREEDAVAIIRILSKAKEATSVSLRFFVTSRPELPIRNGFGEIQGEYQDVALHRIPEAVVRHDISAFLRYKLARIRDKYNSQAPGGLQLPLSWPGEDGIQKLTQMAVPLFIFAATVCRFVEDPVWSDPANQLEKVLEYQTKTHDSELEKLEATYLPILEQLTLKRSDQQRMGILTGFRDIVGPVILVAQPLSVLSLAKLLNISPATIYGKLNSLHSILDVPSQLDVPIRLFHLSFRDFLVDPTKRAKEFWIDETQYHSTLADKCIQLLQQHLRRDICDLQGPGKLRSEVDHQTIDAALPPVAQYACKYWVQHIKEGKRTVQDGDLVHSFLTSHLLHWLEGLSLIGRVSESIGMLEDLRALLHPTGATELSVLLRDINRFILSNRSAIDTAPLQVYASALVFSPACSLTRCLFKQEERKWITTGPIVEDNWNACTQTLEGHSHSVWSVAFSPDSKWIASGSADRTVKIWDAATGTCTQTLEGHSDPVWSVAFSPDSKWIASGSEDWTVKIWDAATGTCTQTLEGHSDLVWSVAFSPDSKWIASGSEDRTVKIWDAATGTCTQTLEGHSDWVWSVAFSPDSKWIASGSDDRTVKIWDAATGTCTQTLEGHSDSVLSVASSLNSKLITSGSDDANPSHYQGYGISSDTRWIMRGTENWLWLPPEYRPTRSAVAASTVAIGCGSGRILIMTFPTDNNY